MLHKIVEYSTSERVYIRHFSEIQCDFDDDDSMLRVLEDYKIDRHVRWNKAVGNRKNDDPAYVEHMVAKEFRKSISGITCFLIGYLILTNSPYIYIYENFRLLCKICGMTIGFYMQFPDFVKIHEV